MERVSALVVGAGPVGLIAASLLGRSGVSTLIVERNDGPGFEPRAVSLDDGSMRVLQSLGFLDELRGSILPGTGTRYFNRLGKSVVYARGPAIPMFGHPVKNPFAQPELERVLLKHVAGLPTVEYRPLTAGIALRQNDDGVEVSLGTPEGSPAGVVRADYVLACDGGRSTIRDLLGIPLVGSSFNQPWLVIDTIRDPHDERYGMHHGDPRRPHVIVAGTGGRCRYEFMVLPGESGEEALRFPNVEGLLSPYRKIAPEDIERSAVYTFHALVAERWQEQRVFLAGDAAHMMPPFAGQGLNSGIQDANNLTWKIASNIDGTAGQSVLESYQAERRPHAELVIDLSVRLGSIVMTTRRPKAWLRDVVASAVMRVPPSRRYLEEMRYKRVPQYRVGAIVPSGGAGGRLVGRPFPQPTVVTESGNHCLLDDALGPGYAILSIYGPDAVVNSDFVELADPVWSQLAVKRADLLLGDRSPRLRSGRTSVASLDPWFDRAAAECAGHLVFLRPDRVVCAVFRPEDTANVSARIAAMFAPSTRDGSEPRTPPT